MTMPAWRAGSATSQGNAGSLLLALSFAHAGDYVLICVQAASNVSSVTSSSGGWTRLTPSGAATFTVFGLTVASGDVSGNATIAFSGNTTCSVVAGAWSSCGGASGARAGTAGSGTSVAAPSYASIWDESLAVVFAMSLTATTTGSWTMASGFTSREVNASGFSTSGRTLLADKGTTSINAGVATGTATFTSPQSASNQAAMILLAGSPLAIDVTASATLSISAATTQAQPSQDANNPQIVTQVAFGQGPNVIGYPQWTDVSDRTRSFTSTRGRSYELDSASAGSGTIVFDDTAGDLDPTNASGAFYPNVKPMRRARCVAIWNNTLYPIWAGLIRRWPLSWQSDTFSQSSTATVDALGTLQGGLLSSIASAMASSSPVHLWPLDEQMAQPVANGAAVTWQFRDEGSSQLPISIDYSPPSDTETLTTGASLPVRGGSGDAIPAADSSEGVEFAIPVAINGHLNIAATATDSISLFPKSGQTVTWEIWATNTTVSGLLGSPLVLSLNDGTTEWFRFTLDTTQIQLTDSAGATFNYPAQADGGIVTPPSSSEMTNDVAHQFVVTLDASGGALVVTIGVDGTAVSYLTVATTALPTADVLNFCLGGSASTASYGTYTVHAVAMYQRYLGSDEVADHWASYIGYAGDLTGARALRILTFGGWNGARSIADGNSTMQACSGMAGSAISSQLQQVVDTEFGSLYVDAAGVLSFAGRDHLSDTTPAATFGDLGTEISYEGDIAFGLDPDYVYDRVIVQRSGGAIASTRSPSTTGDDFANTLSKTIYSDSDADAFGQAAYLADAYAAPLLRISTLNVSISALCAEDLKNTTVKAASVLGLEIGDVVTVNRRGASTVTGSFRIQQIGDAISGGSWMRSYQLSPLLPAPTW